jgi:hypothetical protein
MSVIAMRGELSIRVGTSLVGVIGEPALISHFSRLLDTVKNEGEIGSVVQLRRLLSMETLTGSDVVDAAKEVKSLDSASRGLDRGIREAGLGSRTQSGRLISELLLEYLSFAAEEGVPARLEVAEGPVMNQGKGQVTVTFDSSVKPH